MKKIYLKLYIIIGLVLSLNNCGNIGVPGDISTEAGFNSEISIVDDEEVPVVIFTANDSSSLGTAFWNINENSNQDPFLSIETSLKKVSGYSYGQYGIVFCYQDDGNYYLLSIDTEGGYSFGKMVNGVLIDLLSYSSTSHLILGYDQWNSLQITRAVGGIFEIMFNGSISASITDTTFESGASGYFAYVASEHNEDFPATAVIVKFLEL